MSKIWTMRLVVLAFGLALWFMPVPSGLELKAWHLFAIFITTIFSIIIGAFPVFIASILALVSTIFTGVLTPSEAYSGFSKGFILLILVAFLVANAVVKSGLGRRISLIIISFFGKSTLGLGYSMFFTDMLIAPAFPSNTARSGVLYPLTLALARDSGSKVEDDTQKDLGNFLMMNMMAGLSISSALWLTAMAANPAGAGMAKEMGIDITFASWFTASIVPCAVAALVLPYILFKVMNPKVKSTPQAPAMAKESLKQMGSMSFNEIVTGLTFIVMVALWATSSLHGLPKEAIAFSGLAVVMATGIFTEKDMKAQGGALSTFLWFAVLYTLSSYLNKFGFMTWIGDKIAEPLNGMNWFVVYLILISSYVLIHYFFVSQTAQMMALFSVFLAVGIKSGVPGELLALMLLFATNFNAAITPQGSSANVLAVGSGYLKTSEIYKYGAIITFTNLAIFLVIGTPWVMMITG